MAQFLLTVTNEKDIAILRRNLAGERPVMFLVEAKHIVEISESCSGDPLPPEQADESTS